MLSPGDWLEMPSHNADGDVEQIGLTTVMVRNWDKTITTIPTYSLITEPFKNWRGMSESGGRRIKRSLLVDVSSIRLCDEAMLKRFGEIEHIGAHIRKKEAEVDAWNVEHGVIDDPNRVNGRRLTNVGSFRAYIEAYLRNHPDISQEMTLLVRQLAPTGEGLPIELYCFSTNKNWAAYEGIQADIFDHLLAVAPEFDLRVFQHPSGVDLREALQSLSKRQEQN
jgi:miniconductance mechanosensitive channel